MITSSPVACEAFVSYLESLFALSLSDLRVMITIFTRKCGKDFRVMRVP